jgi:DNA repair exonuclease SbcCD ATPase subunit
MNRDQLREAVLGTAAWSKAGLVTESTAPVQEQEVISEAKVTKREVVEEHVCPLCESQLEEELSDEQLLEHAEAMLTTFQQAEQLIAEAEEGEEEEEEDEEEELEEEVDLLEGLDEDEVDQVVALVNEMYAKKKGAMKPKKG